MCRRSRHGWRLSKKAPPISRFFLPRPFTNPDRDSDRALDPYDFVPLTHPDPCDLVPLTARASAQCLKFRSDQLQDVKRMEKLNNQLMRHMVNKHGEAAAE